MKRLKTLVVAILAVAGFAAWGSVPAYIAGADEVFAPPEISVEISEKTTEYAAGVQTPADGEIFKNSDTLESVSSANELIIDEDVDKFLQPILCGAAGLVGTLIVVAFCLFFLKKYGKEIKEFLKWLRERKISFEEEEKELKAIDEHILLTYNKLEELREKNGAEYAEVLNWVKDLISKVLKENADTLNLTDEHYHDIMVILEMIATGNSELVRKGVADNIVKKIEATHKG